MTAHVTPIADAFVESLSKGKAATITRNSTVSSNICVGSRLRIKRTFQGISQQELSERLGIDSDDLNAYEAGTERVTANLLLRIAKLLARVFS